MPANLDYPLYFNIIFFGAIGVGFLIGYIRGLKKTVYSLAVIVLFYVLFFVTLELVINKLWVLSIPSALQSLSSILPDLSGAQTIGDAVFAIVEKIVPAEFETSITNEVFISFVTGVAQFVLKIGYTIIYFVIGLPIFKLIFFMLRLIFFKSSKKNKIPKFVVLTDEQINSMNEPKHSKKEKSVMLIEKKKEENKLKKHISKMSNKEKKSYFGALGKNIHGKDLKLSKKELKIMKFEAKTYLKELKKRVKKMSRKDKKAFYILQRIERDRLKKLEKSRYRKSKKPLFGALAGATKGVVTAFVGIIVLGGILNITESLMVLLPEDNSTSVNIEEILQLSTNIVPLTASAPVEPLFDVPENMMTPIEETRNMIDAYNANAFIKMTSQITFNNSNYSEAVPLNLYLFDSVFSFQFSDETILLRNELSVFDDTASILLNSKYMVSRDLSDIEAEEISTLFIALSESKLVTSLLPLAIEVGSDYFDTPVEIPIDELYAIDWANELEILGAVAAVGFGLVNDAGMLTEGNDLETVTFDGSDVSSLFDSLADSELVTLSAYVAIEPLLEQIGGQIDAIITVPEDIKWDVEFRAFGEVAAAVLDTGLTVGELQGNDPTTLIMSLSEMDFTILLSSDIVSFALKNIFDGTAGVEGLDMIVVPANIVWFDIYNETGELVTPGELRNILLAVNEITSVAGGFDFNNLDFNIIADFDDPTIDTIFNSKILVASISIFVLDMDLGSTPLVIPDSVLDSNGYLLSVELKAVAISSRVLVSDLACDEFDTVCQEAGFDVTKAFSLSDTLINTLTTSKILTATIGDLIIDSGEDILVIPNSAKIGITVDTVPKDIIKREEIKSLFKAISVLGFTDLNNMVFDASIITRLATVSDITILDTDKSNDLFSSGIVHATISKMLFDLTEGTESVLSVPYLNAESIVVREYNDIDEIEYISLDELEDILQVLLTLEITDFKDVGTFDISAIIEDADFLLNSAILHATISAQMLELDGDAITVPYKDELGNRIRNTVSSTLDSTDTEYIQKTEIINLLKSLNILGITDITTFNGSVDLNTITSNPANITTILESAILHATISTQLIDLDVSGTIDVPYKKEDDITFVRKVIGDVGFETEYVLKAEIRAMIDAMDILGFSDVEDFTGTVSFDNLFLDDNITTVLLSSTIQATISQQLIDLDADSTIILPFLKEDGHTFVRVIVGDVGKTTEYVTTNEIEALIDAIDILGFNDIESFGGSISITVLTEGTNFATIFSSSTIQATISNQIIALESDASMSAEFAVPFVDELGTTDIRVTVGSALLSSETEYIVLDELEVMIDGMKTLGIDDVQNFNGAIVLTPFFDPLERTSLLKSSIMQATISKQLIKLSDEDTLQVPIQDVNFIYVRVTAGNIPGEQTEYVTKVEIGAMFDALNQLGFTDINAFTGTINLSNVYGLANQNIVLDSAAMHATISKQMADLPGGSLIIPTKDIDNNEIVKTVLNTNYIVKEEIRALIDVLELFNIDDINNFDGTFDFVVLQTLVNQNTLLESASIHATITEKMLELEDAVLIVPEFTQDGVGNYVRKIVDGTEFVIKDEIKALINAFTEMGYNDIDNLPSSFSTSQFFDSRTILLASHSIQMTVSDKMLNSTGGKLVVPDTYYGTVLEIRIDDTYGVYIDINEINAIFTSLEELGMSDFDAGTLDFSASNLFASDYTVLLGSASIQATISENILVAAEDETTSTVGHATLIVPTFFRQSITVDSVSKEQITIQEIKDLLKSLDTLGLGTFGGNFDASIITTMTEIQLIDMLASGSVHSTIDNMLRANGGITIPTKAEGIPYTFTMTTSNEVKLFILATQKVLTPGSDFTNVSFTPADLIDLENPDDRDIVANSMISRATLTPLLEALVPGPTHMAALIAADYEDGIIGTFLTKVIVLDIVN